jgi:hypothetical protein
MLLAGSPRRVVVTLLLAATASTQLLDLPAPRRVQPGRVRDDAGFVSQDYAYVAAFRTDVDPAALLLLRQHGIDRRRHQDVPHAGTAQAGQPRKCC